jgi:hypothetical protein
LLKTRTGYLEIAKRDIPDDKIPDGGVCIERVDRDARAAQADVCGAVELVELGPVRPIDDEAEAPGRHGSLESCPGAVGHNSAVVEDDHPVSDLVCLGQMVGREEHRAALVSEMPHHSPERLTRFHVHGRRRLVQEHDLGVSGNGKGKSDTLRLAARKAVGSTAEEPIDVRAFDDLVERRRSGVKPSDQPQGLVNADSRGQAASGTGLQHSADSSFCHR